MLCDVGNTIEDILEQMRENPENVRFTDLHKVCVGYFGNPRRSGGSHVIFKTPWLGDPRINIQKQNGQAKRYQVLQVLAAVDKLNLGGTEK